MIQNKIEQKVEAETTQVKPELKQAKIEVDNLGQYSRRNCVVLHGLPMNRNENTDQVVKQFCWERLNYELCSEDLDQTHRLFSTIKQNELSSKPTIVQFVSHNVKKDIYLKKKPKRHSIFHY